MLAFKHHRRGFDNLILFRHGRSFHYGTPKVTAQHFGAAVRRERLFVGRDNLRIERVARPLAPVQLTIVQPRLKGIAMQAKARHRVDILMQQAAFQQLAHQHRHAARGLEVVNVRRTVRV